MAKRKKRGPGRPKGSKGKKSEEKKKAYKLSKDTKKSIIGVVLIGISLILFLAAFAKAGPAGDFLYQNLTKLFGIGYYLLPLIGAIVGVLFLITHEKKFLSVVFFGMGLFILSGLGLIDVLAENKAGFIGGLIGALETPFGRAGSLILLVVLVIASLLVTLNASIKLPWPPKKKEGEKDDKFDSVAYVEEEKKKLAKQTEMPAAEEEEKELEIAQSEEKKTHSEEEFSAALKKNSKSAAYVAPPLSLLKSTSEKPTPGDLRANANIIKRTLESFGVPVEMGEINIGPKVTRYTLKPAQGVKINRITALSGDLALALAAHPIRIEAPIPGKSLVGIEVPNKQASLVRLGSLLSYPEFTNGKELIWPMGRDVSGEPIFSDIAKLPHLLIAGATGAGKSILVHSILIPMLFKNSPDMLKLILIDPKRVELTVYDGIPHLVSPVITEGKKSIAVFRWAINEMDRRYNILMQAGARDIQSYNKKNKSEPLPYIIMVIDELADLMSAYGKEVEGYIVRLAQMARATGIHLILATQRPSVEVVTGLIKANMPGRVGLQVASQIDSRTILDASGAEKLLGAGDMLFISKEYSKPKRIQGSFISEKEIKDVIKFIEDNNPDLITEPSEDDGTLAAAVSPKIAGEGPTETKKVKEKGGDVFDEFMSSGGDDEDDKLEEAIEVVRQAGKASASLLQRRLQVGYARAARILDIMEERELIGPARGAKPREIYMDVENEETSKEI